MENQAGKGKARSDKRRYAYIAECRHALQSCSHKIRIARACRRYAVSGGRFGDLAFSLIM